MEDEILSFALSFIPKSHALPSLKLDNTLDNPSKMC